MNKYVVDSRLTSDMHKSTHKKLLSSRTKKKPTTKRKTTTKKKTVTKRRPVRKTATKTKTCDCKKGKHSKVHRKKKPLSPYMKFSIPMNRKLRAEQPGHKFGWYGKEVGRMWREKQKKEGKA